MLILNFIVEICEIAIGCLWIQKKIFCVQRISDSAVIEGGA
jgi:hypothetical protein